MRDLTWLLNTHADVTLSEFDAYDEIPSSVLNYGVENVSGKTLSSLGIDDMRYRLSEALQRFEPRIIPNTVSIIMDTDPGEMSNRALQFEIRGDLWTQPIPESLFIRTELDLETGKSSLDWGGSGG
jgi:type VI secretion system protein ImpF